MTRGLPTALRLQSVALPAFSSQLSALNSQLVRANPGEVLPAAAEDYRFRVRPSAGTIRNER